MDKQYTLRKFDTKVQHLKYKVLRQVARHAWEGELLEHVTDIPGEIVPGKKPTMRCCVYKERAILSERVKLAMGGHRRDGRIIQVIDIACDECPAAGYEVTDSCRGCLAHRCEDVCKRGAISFDYNHVAHIDKSKCVECGACARVCPYAAIVNRKRPCQNACRIKAISINNDGAATVDYSKCVECGACVYQCPFGAITDRSFILDTVGILKECAGNGDRRAYAVVAPSVSGQFTYARPGQVVAGLEALGFHRVVEAALGADMVALSEAKELSEKGFLISSCCPSFVEYIEKAFPELLPHVSQNPSPMTVISKYLKERDPGCRVVFIGPCTAKKGEVRREEVRPFVDAALTFEELQALFDSRDIDIRSLEDSPLENASYYGRLFAGSGGLSKAVERALEELGSDFRAVPVVCDGIEACRAALVKKSKGLLEGNFIEGMVCTGGCIGGAGCLTHGEKNRAGVEKYAREALEKNIGDAVGVAMPGQTI